VCAGPLFVAGSNINKPSLQSVVFNIREMQDISLNISNPETSQWSRNGESWTNTASVDAKHWLKLCEKNHSSSKQVRSGYLPPRLLHICEHSFQLMERSQISTKSLHIGYATLSHCWGGIRPRAVLRTANYDQMLLQTDNAELPLTFQHAENYAQDWLFLYLDRLPMHYPRWRMSQGRLGPIRW
jgi:hypothetical protein